METINDQIQLKEVEKSDLEFLYDLLKERDSIVNISHKKMPTFQEHLEFFLSQPYTKWYIILLNKEKIGSIYLSKQDEIGIFLKNKIKNEEIKTTSLKLLMNANPRKRYLANINPRNSKCELFFKKNKFKLIQHTYEIIT